SQPPGPRQHARGGTMTAPAPPAPPGIAEQLQSRRGYGDRLFKLAMFAGAAVVVLVLAGTAVFLVAEALPALRHYGFLSFVTSDRWAPSNAHAHANHPNPYGIVQFIYGTATTSLIAMVIVVPTAPADDKKAALALGATRWEMIRKALLPRSTSGIVGATILGLGRALGETIAVTMVIGNNVLSITKSIFGQRATMPSVIANEF